jgi:hypothetical protein
VRDNKLGLVFPLGNWSGGYFSEELKFASKNGYKIKVIRGYIFNRESNVFKNYVDNIYKHKINSKKPELKSVSKFLLNSLLGRFGLKSTT